LCGWSAAICISIIYDVMNLLRYLLLGVFICAVPVAAAPSVGPSIPDGFWLRRYSATPYGAHWHLSITVKKFLKAKKKTVATLEGERGASILPLDSMVGSSGYQQYSFKISRRGAGRALKKLRKMGQVKRITQRDLIEPKMTEEITTKIERLKIERKSGGELLKRLTATHAVIDELIAHLEKTLRGYEEAEHLVLFNVVIEEAKK
jgi:hypothetical protein